MLWFHDQTPTGQSVWWQFMSARGDISPGAALVEILKRRIAAGTEDQARLNFYFTSATGGTAPADFFGFRPGGNHRPHRGHRVSIRATEPPAPTPDSLSSTAARQPGRLPTPDHHLGRNPADRRRGGVPGRRAGGGATLSGCGPGQPGLWLDRRRAGHLPGAGPGAGHAAEHHGREVRDPLPQHGGLERLQADLPPVPGPGAARGAPRSPARRRSRAACPTA